MKSLIFCLYNLYGRRQYTVAALEEIKLASSLQFEVVVWANCCGQVKNNIMDDVPEELINFIKKYAIHG